MQYSEFKQIASKEERLHNILIIDDDRGIRDLLKAYLQKNGFKVDTAENTMRGRTLMENNNYDLLIVDVMMPGEDGIEFTGKYKKSGGKLPILMLTAMNEAEDRIAGLEQGADDYLTKPFEPKELELRVNKLIERFEPKPTQTGAGGIFKFGDFEFNMESRMLTKNGERISLSSKESDLLFYFVNNVGKATDRYELAKKFNGISERSIDVQVTRLRQKIEKDSKNPEFIQTDWGKGYVFRV